MSEVLSLVQILALAIAGLAFFGQWSERLERLTERVFVYERDSKP
jgi:hypothetical protein